MAGDFHPEFSDLNLFCVVRDSSFAALQALAPAVKWWSTQKQPPPLVMTRDEIERSIDVFAIEFLDMQQHHRVLFGKDILQDLSIPAKLHRIQVEYELREKLTLRANTSCWPRATSRGCGSCWFDPSHRLPLSSATY